MIYDRAFFDAGISRIGTRCEKWDDPAYRKADDLPMWVADWDFQCAQPIVDASMLRLSLRRRQRPRRVLRLLG